MEDHIWKTKKEKIIDYVRHDPFLKIEEIAEKADTTPRYVRTILSEADISLMKLRKEYAMNIEERSSKKGKLLLSYILNVPFADTSTQLGDNMILNNPNDFEILNGDISQNYIHQAYKHKINKKIWCLNTFSVEKNYLNKINAEDINEYISFPEKLNDKLIKMIGNKSLTISDIKLGVEAVNNQVGQLLDLQTLSPVFKVKQKLFIKNRPVILNIAYFHPGKINISISPNRGITIRRKVV